MLLPFQMAKLSIEMAEKRLDSGQCSYSDKIKMITNIFSLICMQYLFYTCIWHQFGHEVLQSFPSCFVKLVVLSFVNIGLPHQYCPPSQCLPPPPAWSGPAQLLTAWHTMWLVVLWVHLICLILFFFIKTCSLSTCLGDAIHLTAQVFQLVFKQPGSIISSLSPNKAFHHHNSKIQKGITCTCQPFVGDQQVAPSSPRGGGASSETYHHQLWSTNLIAIIIIITLG